MNNKLIMLIIFTALNACNVHFLIGMNKSNDVIEKSNKNNKRKYSNNKTELEKEQEDRRQKFKKRFILINYNNLNIDFIKLDKRLEGHDAPIYQLGFDKNKPVIKTLSDDGLARFWNKESGTCEKCFQASGFNPDCTEAISPDKKLYITVTAEALKTIQVYDKQMEEIIGTISNVSDFYLVRRTSWVNDPNKIFVILNNGKQARVANIIKYIDSCEKVKTFEKQSGKCIAILEDSRYPIGISPDGNFFVTVSKDGKTAQVWDIIKHDDFIHKPTDNNLANDINFFYKN